MFFCDCLSSPVNFLAVFNLNSSFSFTYYTFLDNISLTRFKVWIFSNDDIISLFTFICEFTFSFRTIFYNLIGWFSSFFCYFKLTSFLVESGCVFYRALRAFFNDFCFTCWKIWIMSIFSIISKFNCLFNRFYTNSHNPIFFFSDSLSSFCWVANWFRILNLLSNGYFFLAWLTFIFNFLSSSFKSIVIDYLSFIRNFSFDSLCSFTFSWFSTNLDYSISRLFGCLKLTFFYFYYLAIFDNKSICSFLFSW